MNYYWQDKIKTEDFFEKIQTQTNVMQDWLRKDKKDHRE